MPKEEINLPEKHSPTVNVCSSKETNYKDFNLCMIEKPSCSKIYLKNITEKKYFSHPNGNEI